MYIEQSLLYARNIAMVLNLNIGYVSLQFHIVFNNDFETVEDSYQGLVLKRQEQLYNNKREIHYNDKSNILNNIKVWIDTKLQSSILFNILSFISSIIDSNSSNNQINSYAKANPNREIYYDTSIVKANNRRSIDHSNNAAIASHNMQTYFNRNSNE